MAVYKPTERIPDDIKDILDVAVKPDYMLYALIASGIIIAVLIIWFIIKFSKKKKPV